MSDLVVRSNATYPLFLSTSFRVVCLVCLLGLAVSAVVLPTVAPEEISWVLSHIE
jgi:hypothetical protein